MNINKKFYYNISRLKTFWPLLVVLYFLWQQYFITLFSFFSKMA